MFRGKKEREREGETDLVKEREREIKWNICRVRERNDEVLG